MGLEMILDLLLLEMGQYQFQISLVLAATLSYEIKLSATEKAITIEKVSLQLPNQYSQTNYYMRLWCKGLSEPFPSHFPVNGSSNQGWNS